MQIVAMLLILFGALVTPFYFHALERFRRILVAERPDLADRKGSFSFLYTGMPRIADPNVSLAVIRTAFGPVPRQMKDPSALRYAQRIRLCLVTVLPAYLVAFAILIASAP